MLMILIEFLVVLLLIIGVLTQILIPASKGGLLFPSFRKQGKLEQELAAATQEASDVRLQEAVDIAKGKTTE